MCCTWQVNRKLMQHTVRFTLFTNKFSSAALSSIYKIRQNEQILNKSSRCKISVSSTANLRVPPGGQMVHWRSAATGAALYSSVLQTFLLRGDATRLNCGPVSISTTQRRCYRRFSLKTKWRDVLGVGYGSRGACCCLTKQQVFRVTPQNNDAGLLKGPAARCFSEGRLLMTLRSRDDFPLPIFISFQALCFVCHLK